jgi:formate/nitrite transporter FocA (FNT family)
MSTALHSDQGHEPEPKKASQEILHHEIEEGRFAAERPVGRLFLSGLSVGLDIGFSLLFMAIAKTQIDASIPKPVAELLVANMYAVGFIFVVLGRSELFTKQTTLAVLSAMNRKITLGALARMWAVVYVSNLIGAAAFAWLAVLAGPALGVVEVRAFGEIASTLTAPGWLTIFLSAVLAGWLMGLLSWLVAAARDTISQVVIVWLIATGIGYAHLHHVVAGSVEVLAGVFAEQGVTATDFSNFLLWTTLGNALGGPFYVAVIKYSHTVPDKPG